jgi:hypothetical protein
MTDDTQRLQICARPEADWITAGLLDVIHLKVEMHMTTDCTGIERISEDLHP